MQARHYQKKKYGLEIPTLITSEYFIVGARSRYSMTAI